MAENYEAYIQSVNGLIPQVIPSIFLNFSPVIFYPVFFAKLYLILVKVTSKAPKAVVFCFPYPAQRFPQRQDGVEAFLFWTKSTGWFWYADHLLIPGWEFLSLVQQKKLWSRDLRLYVQSLITSWRKRRDHLFHILTWTTFSFPTRNLCCQPWRSLILFQSICWYLPA